MAVLSFKYGELTSNPVTVKKAVLSTASLPVINKSLVSVVLTLVNSEIKRDITATLKLQLPPSASVKGFEMKKQDKWYPASVVPKQKAAAVVYKEKEKNREVTVTNVTASNLFEIGVYPLPYGVEVLCRLEIMASVDEVDEIVESMKKCAESFEINTTDSDVMPVDDSMGASAVVGESFGKTHFVCKIPPMRSTQKDTAQIPQVSLFWDISSSAKPGKAQLDARLLRLKDLLLTGRMRRISLNTFGSAIERCETFSGVDDLINALRQLEYDGGSFFDELADYVSDCANLQNAPDCILIVTDGVDCLDSIPDVGPGIQIPIHCIADNDVVNMRCLRSLVAISALSGSIFTKIDSDLVEGILKPRPMLRSVKTDQSVPAFVQDLDDGFRCIPDHRLGVINRPISQTGLLITGVMNHNDQQTSCTVTTITAEVVCGKQVSEFLFCIIGDCDEPESENGSSIKAVVLETGHSSISAPDASRIIGHVYAEELYREAESLGLKSGINMTETLTDLAVRYGFCSPGSSLLMLYEEEQFVEHGVVPPISHPARIDFENNEGSSSSKTAMMDDSSNEIGNYKTDAQLKVVVTLASSLQSYLNTQYMPPVTKTNLRCSARDTDSARRAPLEECCRMEAEEECCDMEDEEECCDIEDEVVWSDMAGQNMFLGESALIPAQLEAREEDCSFMVQSRQDTILNESHVDESTLSRKREQSAAPLANAPKIAKPIDQSAYLKSLHDALADSDKHDWSALYNKEKEAFADFQAISPSLFLNTARVLSENGKSLDAFRIATNCLESNLDDVQLLRSVGYLILSFEGSFCNRAIALFDKIRKLSPCEPQSYLDCALSRFYKVSKAKTDVVVEDIQAAQSFLVHILTHQWAARFNEVEWPALILLHYIAEFVQTVNEKFSLGLSEWPQDLERFNNVTESGTTVDSLRCQNFDLALCVWLGWDTDNVDVDLHVHEPSGDQVYYGNKEGVGSRLSRDFTQGYGPEVYILKSSATQHAIANGNEFKVFAKYYASHQDSLLTGATSAVIWTLQKKTGPNFRFVRLDTNKQKTHVTTVSVSDVHRSYES